MEALSNDSAYLTFIFVLSYLSGILTNRFAYQAAYFLSDVPKGHTYRRYLKFIAKQAVKTLQNKEID